MQTNIISTDFVPDFVYYSTFTGCLFFLFMTIFNICRTWYYNTNPDVFPISKYALFLFICFSAQLAVRNPLA